MELTITRSLTGQVAMFRLNLLGGSKIDKRTWEGKNLVNKVRELPEYATSDYGIFGGVNTYMRNELCSFAIN